MLEEIVLPQHWQIQLDQCHFEEGLLILSGLISAINLLAWDSMALHHNRNEKSR